MYELVAATELAATYCLTSNVEEETTGVEDEETGVFFA
jgi:hypothetical protein